MSGLAEKEYKFLEQIERLKELLETTQLEIERLEEENSQLMEEENSQLKEKLNVRSRESSNKFYSR